MPKVGDIPGLKKLPKPNGFFTWYWSVSQLTRGMDDFEPRTARLWHGRGEPTPEELVKIKLVAARLTNDLEDWRFRTPDRPKAPRQRSFRRRSPRGFIYFIRAGERVKVGFTKDVKRRLSQLQTFFPEPLDLLVAAPGSMLMERELHNVFAEHHITREWFSLTPDLARFADRLRDAAAKGEAWKLFPSEAGENVQNQFL